MSTVAEVIAGQAQWAAEAADAIEFFRALPPGVLNLVFGSPPYCDARTYGIKAARRCQAWVEWMLELTLAAQAACSGPVFWVAAGVTRKRNYWPACEGLMWEWWKRGGDCQLYRPVAWLKQDEDGGGTGIPGSGGSDYLRADWEYVMCFKRPGKLAFSDNTAMGHEPVYDQVGGEMSNRNADGRRINQAAGRDGKPSRSQWGDPWKTATRGGCGLGGRRQNGEMKKGPKRRKMDVTAGHDADGNTGRADGRPMPKIANPGNIVRARVGGGHMGSRLCHENEAPFPEALPEFFIRTFSPLGGIVCDPFVGSGTTPAVATRLGRRFIGCDLRVTQIELTTRRMTEPAPPAKPKKRKPTVEELLAENKDLRRRLAEAEGRPIFNLAETA